MGRGWDVFVEGGSDKSFMVSLLRHLALSGIDVVSIGGGISALRNVLPRIQMSQDAGRGVAYILDANADVGNRRARLKRTLEELDLLMSPSFLLPNDQEPGCLETLLQELAIDGHSAVHDCFERYKECLKQLDGAYSVPGMKAKIYAYCEACGVEPRGTKRDYGDTGVWNLDAIAAAPLREFLCGLVSS